MNGLTYAECPHGSDDPSICPPCQRAGTPPARRPHGHAEATMTAVYDSRCPGCDEPIWVGDEISLPADGVGQLWVCVDCRIEVKDAEIERLRARVRAVTDDLRREIRDDLDPQPEEDKNRG